MPDWSHKIRSSITELRLDPSREAQLIEELNQHLSDRYEELMADGMTAQEAYQQASRELDGDQLAAGLRTTLKSVPPELPIGANRGNWFMKIGGDLKHATRQLRLNPGFSIVVILCLALGIGANTTIFQLLDAVRLRSLPIKDPQQLARIHIAPGGYLGGSFFTRHPELSSAIWELIRTRQQGFSEVAAWSEGTVKLGPFGDAKHAETLMVSGNFFNVLGVRPQLGRLILPGDDTSACMSQSVVISDKFWHREFAGKSDVVGKKILLEGHPFQIIGVTPSSFYGLETGLNFDVAVPLCSDKIFSPDHPPSERLITWWLASVGRLKPGWTLQQASAQLASISSGIFSTTVPTQDYDAEQRQEYLKHKLEAIPLESGLSYLREQYEAPLWMLLVLSGLVLLIACANLANLLLARAGARQREIALRLILGASRARLVRQLLTESLLLAILGTVIGALIAQAFSRVLVAFLSTQQTSVFLELTPDWRTFSFAAGIAALTCVIFGLAPAIQASRTDPGNTIKIGGRTTGGGKTQFFVRRVLVVSQVALSIVLLTGALLFVRTFHNLLTMNTGFQSDHVLIPSIDFSALNLPASSRLAYKHQLLSRMRALPGVASAAEASITPLSNTGWNDLINIPGTGIQRGEANFNQVSEGYFQTLRIPLLSGRDFQESDTLSSQPVAIVNRAFAQKFLGAVNPGGRTFEVPERPQRPARRYRIIGLVENTKHYDLREQPEPLAYLAMQQDKDSGPSAKFVLRADIPMEPLAASVKQLISEMSPSIELNLDVFKTQIREGTIREQLMATLSGFFGILAAILATVGIYGVISYFVVRRRNEIGIRIALGAEKITIFRMVFREAGILVAVGIVIGVGLSLALGKTIDAFLYGLRPNDPATLLICVSSLTGVALLATLLPAQKAAKLDPMTTLKEE